MTEDLLTRARELAVYIIENRATIRQAAKHFGLSKSTVHKDITERLPEINYELYEEVKKNTGYQQGLASSARRRGNEAKIRSSAAA